MGQRKMKCIQCGNENVNEILVSFVKDNGVHDTTTLAKFIYYLEHPNDKRANYDPYNIEKILYYSCTNCQSDKEVEGKKSHVGLRIPSRRYGI